MSLKNRIKNKRAQERGKRFPFAKNQQRILLTGFFSPYHDFKTLVRPNLGLDTDWYGESGTRLPVYILSTIPIGQTVFAAH